MAWLWTASLLLCVSAPAVADRTVFPAKTYTLSQGKSVTFQETLDLTNLNGVFTLSVQNGNSGGGQRLSSGSIDINGVTVVRKKEFNLQVGKIEKVVTLQAHNTLRITLKRGPLGAHITLSIVRHINDAQGPQITLTEPLFGRVFTTTPITVGGAATDLSDIAELKVNGAPVPVLNNAFTTQTGLTLGPNTVIVTATDFEGNSASTSTQVLYDVTPPELSIEAPVEGLLVTTPTLQVSGRATDDTGVASVTVNGQPATLSGDAYTADVTLAPGVNTLTVIATDGAGRQSSASRTVSYDAAPPQVTITRPTTGTLVNTASLTVSGAATDDTGVTQVSVNGQPATLSGNTYTAQVTLTEGANSIAVTATDASGKSAAATTQITLDATAPAITLSSPLPGQSTNNDSIRVVGEATDASGVAAVTVNDAPVTLTGSRFEGRVSLQEGDSSVTVTARDGVGNLQTSSVPVSRYSLPVVSITTPADLSLANTATVTVSGTVSDPQASVKVNGIAAGVAGNAFSAANVPIIEGSNILTATVTDARGRIGAASVNVVRDLTPPQLVVNAPLAGSTVSESPVTVTGLVNDIVVGTVNAGQATVTVNGQPAQVLNRSFVLTGLGLSEGLNTLTIVARDASGNQTTVHSSVTLDTSVRARVALVSGNNQSAAIDTPLTQPLIVRVTDSAGQPAPNKTVIFKIKDNNGRLGGDAANPLRQVAVQTDAEGKAQASFTTGTRAGAGNQIIQASSVGFSGPAEFCITVTPATPARIVVDTGDQQEGIAGQPLPQPFVAVVTDNGFNRLSDVPITFRVIRGGGVFKNGQPELTVNSDSDGRVSATLALGPDDGIANNIVQATLASAPQGLVASFLASGRVAGDPANTRVSGRVLDNADQPVPGVTLRIKGTALTTVADANGLFTLPQVPVGTYTLLVDGGTATRPGVWPNLEFVRVAIAGRDNSLNRPIYLLPIDVANGLQVDATTGGTVTSPEIPGFAMTVKPGSVTFPDGSKSGVISVTAVHSDKIPSTPNFGQQPRFIVTIQPAGALFNPPAQITFPNVDGLSAGEVTELYSFDHDLGRFVSIGPGTVSEDGSQLVSNPGVGILKAGWHCGGNPSSAGSPNNCGDCKRCNGNDCVPQDGGSCADEGNVCTSEQCSGGEVIPPFLSGA